MSNMARTEREQARSHRYTTSFKYHNVLLRCLITSRRSGLLIPFLLIALAVVPASADDAESSPIKRVARKVSFTEEGWC